GEPHLAAVHLDRATLAREAVTVGVRVVTAGAAEAEHRMPFARLELRAADQVGILVGLEVGEADDDRTREARSGDERDAAGQVVDEVPGAVLVAGGEAVDPRLEPSVAELPVARQGQRVDLN